MCHGALAIPNKRAAKIPTCSPSPRSLPLVQLPLPAWAIDAVSSPTFSLYPLFPGDIIFLEDSPASLIFLLRSLQGPHLPSSLSRFPPIPLSLPPIPEAPLVTFSRKPY